MKEVEITGPYPISLNAYMRIVNNRLFRTKKANDFKAIFVQLARDAGVVQAIEGFVTVDITLYPKLTETGKKLAKKDSLWAFKVQSLDVDNCLKVLLDSFNKIIYEDDKKIVKLTIRKGVPYCEEGATKIIIKQYEEI